MANSSINLTSLDFDGLKGSLKTFLKSQTQFKDYDFEGSNMNVLLDVLAYNTYLNSFYTNMVAAEQFMDSAQLRDSVVSHAKVLNYLPGSMKSAEALVNLTVVANGVTGTFEIPRGTQFSGGNSNGTFTFVTDRSIVAVSSSNTFTFSNVAIYEGSYVNETFYVDTSVENQKFILSNESVDISSLVVTVYEDGGASASEWALASDLYSVGAQSNVYFLQATSGNRYEVVFGDGVLGRYPKNDSTVLCVYRITDGSAGSGVQTFFLDTDIGAFNGGDAITTITTVSPSSEGAERESIESIRFRAPKAYQVQERAVTAADYRNLVFSKFPEVKDVAVFGGEQVPDTVAYGTVFVSCTTYSGNPLTTQRKTDLISFLRDKRVLSVQTAVIDPQYLYVVPSIRTTVDFNQTSLSPAQIRAAVLQRSQRYNDDNLETFGGDFRLSRYLEYLNDAEGSILSTSVTTSIFKQVTPETGVDQSLSVSLNNSVEVGTVLSSAFQLADGSFYQLTDYNPFADSFYRETQNGGYVIRNSNPAMYLKRITTDNTTYYSEVGTVDYTRGAVTVRNLNVVGFNGSAGIRVYARPMGSDIYSTLNDVVLVDPSRTSVEIVSA